MITTAKPVGYQSGVYQELRELARDHFDYDWHDLAVTPKTAVLICGSTGSGKSFLCRQLALGLDLPFLDLEYSNWVVTGAGARGGLHTLRLLYRFIEKHQRGVIVLDEIDKLGTADGASDWTRSVHVEVMALLDRRVLPGIIEAAEDNYEERNYSLTAEELQQRFRQGYLLIGAGAWQHLWRQSLTAGFGSSAITHNEPTYEELVRVVRPEILNRFRSCILFLPPLMVAEYEALVNETAKRLPPEFGPLIYEAAARSLREAVETQRGFRWIEELVAGAVRILRTSSIKKSESLKGVRGSAPSLVS